MQLAQDGSPTCASVTDMFATILALTDPLSFFPPSIPPSLPLFLPPSLPPLPPSPPSSPSLPPSLSWSVQLKAYVSQDNVTTVAGSTIDTYKAYAAHWNQTSQSDHIFHESFIVLAILVVIIDFFILVLSLGTSGNVYDEVYTEIRHKKNPYYPIFCSVVVLSVLWNAYPGWAVITIKLSGLQFFLVAVVFLQFFTALFKRKYADFPIPGFKWTHRCSAPSSPGNPKQHTVSGKKKKHHLPPKYFFWTIFKLGPPFHALLTVTVQTIAIWSLLVLFTFLIYYAVTIAVALYLNPIQTLIKIVFVKAVAMCAVYGVALLFSSKSLRWKCSEKAFVNNLVVVTMFLAALAFLPILAYLAFMIGGFIFSISAAQLTGIQGVLAILPSAFLVLVGWASRGKLFPEQLVATDSLAEVSKDEKEVAAHQAGAKPDSLHGSGQEEEHQQSATGYGSVDVRPSSNRGDGMSERLLPAKTV